MLNALLTMLQVKLIAEPWDCGGLYQVGGFPNWDVWGEWNGKYRDDVRRFIKGDAGVKSAFATRISGSADLYHVNNRCLICSAHRHSAQPYLLSGRQSSNDASEAICRAVMWRPFVLLFLEITDHPVECKRCSLEMWDPCRIAWQNSMADSKPFSAHKAAELPCGVQKALPGHQLHHCS